MGRVTLIEVGLGHGGVALIVFWCIFLTLAVHAHDWRHRVSSLLVWLHWSVELMETLIAICLRSMIIRLGGLSLSCIKIKF